MHATPRPLTHRAARARTAGRCALLLLSAWVLAACGSTLGPQPWEKGNLAKPEMQMGGDGLEQRFGQHTYNSKEAASGGTGVGGGGCGCN